jgi:hypothetical protein
LRHHPLATGGIGCVAKHGGVINLGMRRLHGLQEALQAVVAGAQCLGPPDVGDVAVA